MLITEVTIRLAAGDGGDGIVSFYKNKRGPDGGNGGNGGNIIIVPTNNSYALSKLAPLNSLKADDGEPGKKNTRVGKSAGDLSVLVPPGTTIKDLDSGETFEITASDDRILLCQGGHGGRGNYEFRSSTNQVPEQREYGKPGEQRNVFINYRLIADIGLIGFPNAGKSSLLKELTAAQPKVGAYPFTTLEPNLGALNGKVLADIPGLIEGASTGKGLGIKFLKHVERVSLLLHCVSCESENVAQEYAAIRTELEQFNPNLLETPEIILLTKTDTIDEKDVKKKLRKLSKLNKNTLAISIHDWDSLEELKKQITY
jgi:GTP-binding protein